MATIANKIKRQRKNTLLKALEQSLGVVTTACKEAKVSRMTFYRWLNDDPIFAKEVKNVENIALDFAESQLYKKIKEGDTTAIIFYLTTKGHHRGYADF